MFNLNHLILEIMNSLYYFSMTMIGYKWLNYVYICTFKKDLQTKVKRLLQIPILILMFLILTNHFNHFLLLSIQIIYITEEWEFIFIGSLVGFILF